MKSRILTVLFLLGSLISTGAATAQVALDTDEAKTLYAVGMVISKQLTAFELTTDELALIQAGLKDSLTGNARLDLDEFGPRIDPYLQDRLAKRTEREKEAGKAFVAEMATKDGATQTESGLVYLEQTAGTGASPVADSMVKVHYHGTFRDGEVFDSSIKKGEPAVFSLNGVVACFSEGIQKMKVGGKSKLVCPPELAYGERGYAPSIPPGTTIVFDVELLEIVEAAAPPAPPTGVTTDTEPTP